jgi:hypothetical protein
VLALGGVADGSFDVGRIGAGAWYRGFSAFEKSGTWPLMSPGETKEATK